MHLTTPEQIDQKLHKILPKVTKPGRYVGGEFNSVVKNWAATPLKASLVFPDIYDIGISNVGLKILYDILNARADCLAERSYAVWRDMEDLMRQHSVPL